MGFARHHGKAPRHPRTFHPHIRDESFRYHRHCRHPLLRRVALRPIPQLVPSPASPRSCQSSETLAPAAAFSRFCFQPPAAQFPGGTPKVCRTQTDPDWGSPGTLRWHSNEATFWACRLNQPRDPSPAGSSPSSSKASSRTRSSAHQGRAPRHCWPSPAAQPTASPSTPFAKSEDGKWLKAWEFPRHHALTPICPSAPSPAPPSRCSMHGTQLTLTHSVQRQARQRPHRINAKRPLPRSPLSPGLAPPSPPLAYWRSLQAPATPGIGA